MNHIYRIVFNRKLGVFQAVSECAHSMGKSGGSVVRRGVAPSLTSAFALAAVLTATGIAMPNLAEAAFITTGGGAGGGIANPGGSALVAGGAAGVGGGVGGAGAAGNNLGLLLSSSPGGQGGLVGGGTGGLGYGGLGGNSGSVQASSIVGGDGGSSNYNGPTIFAGGGGGGVGLVMDNVTLDTSAFSLIRGGNGGNTSGTVAHFFYGYGGSGGAGVFMFTASSTLRVSSNTSINGGNGGVSANSLTPKSAGGAGVLVNAGVIQNAGIVTGGKGELTGGNGITSSDSSVIYNSGQIYGGSVYSDTVQSGQQKNGAGVALLGDDNTLVNAGKIVGGGQLANSIAVDIQGKNNTVELRKGYGFDGSVVVQGGTNNTLAFGGSQSEDAAFDLSRIRVIRTATSFSGFTNYAVKGGQWTMTGSTQTGSPVNWTIASGATMIGAEGASFNGAIQNAGTLRFKTDTATTYQGVLSGAGVLEKTGAVVLLLTGDSKSFSGTSLISNGTLSLTESAVLGGSLLTVANTGRLISRGTVGNTKVLSGGQLVLNASGAFTVNGSLTLDSGSQLSYQLGQPGTNGPGGVSGRLVITGDLNLNSALSLSQADAAAGTPGQGYYRLISYQGVLSGNGISAIDLWAGASPDIYARTVNNDHAIDLFVGAKSAKELQTWVGSNGVWNSSNLAWLNSGETDRVATENNTVVFLTAGDVIKVASTQGLKGAQFVGDDVTLQGNGGASDQLQLKVADTEFRVLAAKATVEAPLTGTGGLLKTEEGTLILKGANTYSGDTTLQAGTLQIDDVRALGADTNTLIFTGGTLATSTDLVLGENVSLTNEGTFSVTDSLTLEGQISGSGDLIKTGAGTLFVNDTTNSYSGDTWVKEGTLAIADGAALGQGATLHLNAGALANTVTTSIKQNVAVTDRGTLDVLDTLTLNGDLSGSGELIKKGVGKLVLEGATTYTGTT